MAEEEREMTEKFEKLGELDAALSFDPRTGRYVDAVGREYGLHYLHDLSVDECWGPTVRTPGGFAIHRILKLKFR